MMDTKQKCLEHILGQMSLEESSRFESRLGTDDALARDYRTCSNDLASFADSVRLDLKPTDVVWERIEKAIESEEIKREKTRGVLVNLTIFATAACLVFLTNLFFFETVNEIDQSGDRIAADELTPPESSVGGEGGLRNPGIADNAAVAADSSEVMLSENDLSLEQRILISDLVKERKILLDRVEYLENSYIDLLELTRPDLEREEGEEDERPGQRLLEMVGSLSADGETAEASTGVWDRVSTLLEGKTLAIVGPQSISLDSGQFDGLTAFRFSSAPVAAADPYALAFVNEEQGVGLLSFVNLPLSAGDGRRVLWATDSEGLQVEAIGEIPIAAGSGSSVAIRLPESEELGARFVVSLEERDDVLPDMPSDFILLETREEP